MMSKQHAKHGLNEPQQDAVETIYGPLLVLAGAGSGKTRVVTYRITHLLSKGIEPSKILGLTFTNKAAGEMKERIQTLTNQNVLICTFHSLGVRILRESIQHLGYHRNFIIYDQQDAEKLMKLCLSSMSNTQVGDAKLFLEYVSRLKNKMLSPTEFDPNGEDVPNEHFAGIYSLYQQKLIEYNAVDFDDLLYLTVRLFKEHPEILSYYQKRWSFLLIDEYQDTNAAQYTMIRYLVEQHQNLCVVGDPDQSIYSWRGADINNILRFEKDYPGAKVVSLEQNYRSSKNILEASNALIQYNEDRYEKKLWSDLGTGEKIKYLTADTEREEARFVANQIIFYTEEKGIPLKEMAIFYRTNAQSRAFEDSFLSNQLPYVIVGGVSFYQRREIKDILAFLRVVESGADFIAFTRTINIPKRGVGEATLDKLNLGATVEGRPLIDYCISLLNDEPTKHPLKLSKKQKEGLNSYLKIIYNLRQNRSLVSLRDLVKQTIDETSYLDYLMTDMETYQDRKENLNSLVNKAAEWELTTENPTLEGFLEELSLKSNLDEAKTDDDLVHLMTLHNGKGLEFKVVFLVGLEEDLFPHANSRGNPKALDEERRLCYVGMTRAKEYLYLCNVRQRFLWGTTRSQNPSRFLREIPLQFIERIPSHRGFMNRYTERD